MSKTIMTVTGPVSTDRLGHTWMHEHLICSSMGIATHYPQMYREKYMEQVVKDIREMQDGGISTVVEATPVCLGRDVRTLKAVSEKTGMNIIATTGWWGTKPPYLEGAAEEMWARCFIDDLTVGCDGTDIKAGILKAAMDLDGPTEWRKVTHHAVGMAHLETGAKIFLHTYCPKGTPRHQLQYLKEAGVDLSNVAVDHLPETCELDLVKWVYDQGAWLGLDRIPCIVFPGEYPVQLESRIRFVKEIFDAGMGDRVLFSHDFTSVSPLFDNQPEEIKEYIAKQIPDRFLFLKKHVFPALADMGLDPEYLWKITEENPKRFFEG